MNAPYRRPPGMVRIHCLLTVALAGLTLLTMAASVHAGSPRWKLIYYRQIGRNVNGGGYTVENNMFREDGTRGSGVGVTNQFNLNTAIWGFASPDGYLRILPDESAYRDVRIYHPGIASDQTPNLYHFSPTNPNGRYSFETQWMYISDDARVTAYPQMPVYHYDLVSGINNSQYVEPPGMDSDAFALTTWTQPVYQTFVVPGGINRLVSCKAWVIDTHEFRFVASIHQDNGGHISTWPQVGPSVFSRSHHPIDFVPVIANWGLHDVQVVPGQRYALKLRPEDNQGFNSYATLNNNYPQGHMWLNDLEVPHRDLLAVVVGVGYDINLSINRSPASFTRSIVVGQNLSSNTFTVSNGGTGTLVYNISSNAAWLTPTPTSGTSTGESDTITINYSTASLAVGNYTGTITITAAGASNSPRTVTVNLSVTLPPHTPADHDRDGDVDQQDYGWFQACYSGPGIPQNAPECAEAKLDNDPDVDQADFIRFANCMQGPNVLVSPTCAN